MRKILNFFSRKKVINVYLTVNVQSVSSAKEISVQIGKTLIDALNDAEITK